MFAFDLLVVLLAALLGRVLSKKIRQPVVLGEILVGMVIGSLGAHGIALVGDLENLESFGNVGIMVLLFSAGLATSLEELKSLGKPSFAIAIGGVVLPFSLGYIASIAFGYTHLVALLVGTGLVATSVGVNAEILTELRVLRTRLGTLIMGAALADDVVGIMMLSFVVSFATSGEIPIMGTLANLALTVLFFALSLFLGTKALLMVSERMELGRYDLLLVGLIVAVALGAIAEAIGLAMIVGGFVAGLMVGQSRYGARLIQQSTLIGEGFFVPIFFVVTGMEFEPEAILTAGGFTVAILVVAIAGKMLGCFAGSGAMGFSRSESAAIGIAMVPRAGVELVLIKIGSDAGVFGPEVVSTLLVMVIVTTVMTPPLLSYALRKLGLAGKGPADPDPGIEL